MSSTAKLYAFSALIFAIGAIASLLAGHWGSLLIFAVLTAMMVWITFRVDRVSPEDQGDQPPKSRR